jgi:hypothetical protein
MNPPPAPDLKPFRTGFGWLWQCLTRPRPNPAPVAAFFPGSGRQATSEVMIASLWVALWSFLACGALVVLESPLAAWPLAVQLLIWPVAWFAFLHIALFTPSLVLLPFLKKSRLSPASTRSLLHLGTLSLFTALSLYLCFATHPASRALGGAWITLILLDCALRLLRRLMPLATPAD